MENDLVESETSLSASPMPGREQETSVDLVEFCTRLSQAERSVELVAVFHHLEIAAGRLNDLPSEYQARFNETKNRPAL